MTNPGPAVRKRTGQLLPWHGDPAACARARCAFVTHLELHNHDDSKCDRKHDQHLKEIDRHFEILLRRRGEVKDI